MWLVEVAIAVLVALGLFSLWRGWREKRDLQYRALHGHPRPRVRRWPAVIKFWSPVVLPVLILGSTWMWDQGFRTDPDSFPGLIAIALMSPLFLWAFRRKNSPPDVTAYAVYYLLGPFRWLTRQPVWVILVVSLSVGTILLLSPIASHLFHRGSRPR